MRRVLIGVLGCSFPAVASAQLRVVAYNSLDGPASTADPNFRLVFQAIAGNSVNGIARRPDVVSLQEQTSSSTANLAGLLNAAFGVTSYVAVQPTAGQTP